MTMRIIPSDQTDYPPSRPKQRSEAQKLRDQILENAETKLAAARDLLADGLEYFAVVEDPVHKTQLTTLLTQQIEQVAEYRRLKG